MPEMAAKKTQEPQTKTAFILRLPVEMSPKEVVSKAKEAGIELSEKYVATIRSNARAKKRAKRAAAKATTKIGAAKTSTAKKSSKKTSKKPATEAAPATSVTTATAPTATEFISSQPTTIPAADVVKAAKMAGLKITTTYVYTVRSRLAAKAAKPPAPKAAPVPKTPKLSTAKKALAAVKTAAPKLAAKVPASNIEGTFKRLVVELGVARAFELVGDVRRTLAELFGAG
jgi:carnitine O-acetyltransferase